ncbi:cyclin-L1-like [Babylonia areolata]|uniref:cyclin-L1-like n=1 Tax=Babylonia areolata TaxID=304850 RepID=UPI003FD22777
MADEQVQTLNTPLPRDFSRVVLTLENVLLDEEKLKVSPSMIDGISKEDEYALRFVGCNLIQTAGLLLKLPQTAMATGQVVFHRFYYSKSLVKHNYEILAMACMYVAAKIEESPCRTPNRTRRLRDVLNVFHHMKQVRTKRPIRPLVLDSNYILLKNEVIKAERHLLIELGFCVHVEHPHKLIVSYLQILELSDNRNIIQYAWNLMNDSLRTDVFVRYSPGAIACACIFLAARRLRVPMPNRPPWYYLFGVDDEAIEAICKMLLYLYNFPKPDQDRLEKLCEDARQQQLEEKRKAKVGLHSLDGTPNSASRTDSPKVGASPNMVVVKKVKTEDDSRITENGSSSEKNGQKKRRLDDSEGSRSQASASHSRSRSRSHSPSPPSRKKKHSYSPSRSRNKRDRSYDYDYHKEKRIHKRKKHARSRSRSRSPRSPSPSPVRYTSSAKASKKYSKEKRRSYSPAPEKPHRSRKHRNGQRDSPRYTEKYRR